MAKELMNCANCGKDAAWLTEVDKQWVGPCCVPDAIWAMYPGWREREALRVKRSQLARRNFHEKVAAA